MIRDAFLESSEAALGLLREPALTERWSEPSALPDFSTGGLARHLANQITGTRAHLAEVPGDSAIPILDHFTGNSWITSGVDSVANAGIRGRSETSAAATTAGQLAGDVDAALRELRAALPGESAGRIIDLGEWGLTLDDFLLTRVLELVVHTDDLAVSLNLPTPSLPAEATGATIVLLGRIAAWRHGPVNVIRALARQERAPASIAAL
jgi:hypothetical protein